MWSAVLTTLGLTGLYLVGRGSNWGWVVTLVDQAVWTAYGAATHQWSFLLSAAAYATVAARELGSGDAVWGRLPARQWSAVHYAQPPRRGDELG